MTQANPSETSRTSAKSIVVERTFRATLDEVWDLWTTKDGFESWWGPEGFRVEVHALELRVGGKLHYDMIADTPETIAAMKEMGWAPSHQTRGEFVELEPKKRLRLRHVIDFIPGVAAYENTMAVELVPSGDRVRMMITLEPMHTEEFSKMQHEGLSSQLRKLEKRFGSA